MQIDKKYYILFFVAVLAISIHFKYLDILFYYPQSADMWRQADCASFAFNYYQHGMHFFEPEIHNLLSGSGKAVGEFPIIYYCVAFLYKIFGPHIFIFRLFNLVIFYFGLTALFKLTYRLTSDIFFAIVTPLLFFSTPLVLFYANNFLSDVPSVSFVFIAFNYILSYKESHKLKHFWIAMLFFTLAALLKANSIIVFVALGSLFFIEWNNWGVEEKTKIFKHNLINALGFAASLILVIVWYRWVIHYNETNHSIFLGTQAWPGWPLWEVSNEDFVSSLVVFFHNLNELFTLPLSVLFLFLLLFVLLNLNSLPYLLKGTFILLITGMVIFYMFFYVGFRNQSYYYINLLVLPIFTFICSAIIVSKKLPFVFNSNVFRFLIFGLLLVSIYNGKASTKVFYRDGWKHAKLNKNFYDKAFPSYLKSIGITPSDTVLSVPDDTPNTSLYMLNTKGWSNYGFEYGKLTIRAIENKIKNGCKYLVVSDSTLLSDSTLIPYLNTPIGNFGNIYFFKLYSSGKPIWLKTNNENFVGVNKSNQLEASSKEQVLFLIDLHNGNNSISSKDGYFISSDGSSSNILMANRLQIEGWEKFTIEKVDSISIVLKASNNMYVGINSNVLYANKKEIKAAEKFRIIYK